MDLPGYYLNDLQQLWEDTHGKEKVSWSTDQSPDDLAAKASPSNDFPVPLDDQRLISVEKGERGTSQFKETFVPQGAAVAIDPSLAMLFDDGATGTFLKTLNNATVETSSELPTQTVQVIREIVVSPESTDDDTPTFEKLEAMIDDLQLMLKKVKQNILDQAANRTTEKPAESEDMSDPISEEMERKVVEDVIERMRGSFMRAARGSKTMNEIDSSVSASVVDVQAPLQFRLPGIRHRRESSDVLDEKKKVDEDSNCNDPKLKELIMKNIGKTAQLSKRAIQKAAEVEFGGTFDVICSPCEFSFVISSQKYCDGTKDQIACFVFLQPPTSLSSV